MNVTFDPSIPAECNAAVRVMLSFGYKFPTAADLAPVAAAAPSAPIAPDDRPDTGNDAPSGAVAAPAPIAPVVQSVTSAFLAQPPAAPPAAPLAPAPTAAASTSAAAVFDSSGLAWDERIHSLSGDGTKPQKEDGTWRQKRGVNSGTVALVTAELRKQYPQQTFDAQARAAAAPVAAAPAPAAPAPAPAAPPSFTPPPANSAPQAGTMTFAQLAQAIQQAGYQQDQVTAACVAAGLPNFPSLATQPDKVLQVAQALYLAV